MFDGMKQQEQAEENVVYHGQDLKQEGRHWWLVILKCIATVGYNICIKEFKTGNYLCKIFYMMKIHPYAKTVHNGLYLYFTN